MDTDTQIKLQKFFSAFTHLKYNGGQILILPDSSITDIYYLKSGAVRMYSVSADGEEITLNHFKASSYFPIMLILAKQPNSYYFETVEPSEVYRAPVEAVTAFLKNNPELLFDLAVRFSYAINGLTKRIESLAFQDAHQKVTNLLSYFAKKYGPEIHMTHEEIASWLGLERETVSRHIYKLEKEGFLTRHGKGFIVTKITE